MVRLLNRAAGDISIICQSVRISFCLFLALSSLPVRNLSQVCLHSLSHRNLLNYKEGFPKKIALQVCWEFDLIDLFSLSCARPNGNHHPGLWWRCLFQSNCWSNTGLFNTCFRCGDRKIFHTDIPQHLRSRFNQTKIGNKHVQWNISGNRYIIKIL